MGLVGSKMCLHRRIVLEPRRGTQPLPSSQRHLFVVSAVQNRPGGRSRRIRGLNGYTGLWIGPALYGIFRRMQSGPDSLPCPFAFFDPVSAKRAQCLESSRVLWVVLKNSLVFVDGLSVSSRGHVEFSQIAVYVTAPRI